MSDNDNPRAVAIEDSFSKLSEDITLRSTLETRETETFAFSASCSIVKFRFCLLPRRIFPKFEFSKIVTTLYIAVCTKEGRDKTAENTLYY